MNLGHVSSFRELVVYRKAREAAQLVFEASKGFPREEMYALTDQIRRASRSIGAQIAEAWGKRRYERHFVAKLTDADAEQMETQHWVESALDCGYITSSFAESLLAQFSEIGRMLNGMMAKSDLFCGHESYSVKEEAGEYVAAHCSLVTDN